MVERVKVLHFIDSEGVYGAERVILNLSREHCKTTSIEPVVGCMVPVADAPSALYEAARADGLSAMRLPVANSRVWLDLPRVAAQLRRENIGLIHAHGYKAAVFGYLIKLMTGIPVLSTCHLWFEPERGPLKMRVMVALEKWLYRWFPKILAVSDDIRSTLISHGVDPQRVEVIVNGVDIEHSALSDAARALLYATLNISPSDFCVLNAARLTRQKSQRTLIDAAALLKAAGVPCKVLIVGAGELQAELAAYIREKNVVDCVALLGFRADVEQLMGICHAFALPSLDEGMPMSLLEAAVARLPIVATAVGDIPKLVQDGVSGLIVPVENAEKLAQALSRLRDDAALRAQLAEGAYRQLVSQYSCGAMGASYARVYSQILAPNKRAC